MCGAQFPIARAAPPRTTSLDFLLWRFSNAGRRSARHRLRAAGIRVAGDQAGELVGATLQVGMLLDHLADQANAQRFRRLDEARREDDLLHARAAAPFASSCSRSAP